MLLDQIRQATRQAHQELDHEVYSIIQQVINTSGYKKLLQTFYGYYKPVYTLIEQHLTPAAVPDYNLRRKPEMLIDDIQCFPGGLVDIQLCRSVPVITNISQAIGAYYVLEGSTMGGPLITKKIVERLRINDGAGFSFFLAYGGNNRQMWNNFLTFLTDSQYLYNTLNTVNAVTETFSKFKNWLTYSYAATPTFVI